MNLSSLQDGTGTDDQLLSLAGTTLSIEDGNSVNLTAIGSDDQNISGSGLSGTTLTIGIEGGDNETVNLSSLQDGTGTDDQNITGSSLSGTNLTIGIEGGTSQTVDLSSLAGTGTDDQDISGSGLSGTTLTIGIEGGDNETVDLSSLQDGTGTDDQNITGSSLSGTNLTIGIEGGTSQTVDLSSLAGTGTDDQDISGSGLSGTTLTIGIEGGDNETVDLSSLQDGTGSDDQNISGSGLSGSMLTIGIEGGNNETVDLSSLTGTGSDDQNITGSSLSGTNLTIGIEGGSSQVVNLAGLQDGTGSDDQTLSLSGTTLSIEDGNSVNLSSLSTDELADADNDTKIQVEEGTDDDVIRFDVAGTQVATMDGKTFALSAPGESVFIGSSAGSNDDGSTNQNTFVGYQSGQQNTTGEFNTFNGYLTGNLNTTGSQNTFMGYQAGDEVTEGSNNTFVGYKSGQSNNTGSGNVFLGSFSGADETGSDRLYIDNITTNTPLIWGDFANNIARINGRLEVISTGESVFIGSGAGSNDDGSTNRNTFIGYQSGQQNTTGSNNTFIGNLAGTSNTIGGENTFNGYLAGEDNINGSSNTFFGRSAGRKNSSGGSNTYIGRDAGGNNSTGGTNTFLGKSAGVSNVAGSGNVFLGNAAGGAETGSNLLYIDNSGITTPLIWGDFANNIARINGTLNINSAFSFPTADGASGQVMTTDGSGSVAWANTSDDQNISGSGLSGSALTIGIEGGTSETVDLSSLTGTGSDDQNITGSSLSGTDLTIGIEGGSSQIVNLAGLQDGTGTDDQDLTLSSNSLSIEDGNSVDLSSLRLDELADTDNDTKIQVEEGADEDVIRFDVAGTEFGRMDGKTFHLTAPGESVFIGSSAGSNDDGTDNQNTFVGHESGQQNTSGINNTFFGFESGQQNTTGDFNTFNGFESGIQNTTGDGNTFVGFRAGESNNTGSGNIFLGRSAGKNETGSNKLFIHNSNTTTPLIWGDFANNIARINGTLDINNAFSFPTADGASGQVLTTDGSGNVAWGSTTVDVVKDADNDTKIQVEESADEDVIRFDVAGAEFARMDGKTFHMNAPGLSVFIGSNAGSNDDGSNNENTFVGYQSGQQNTTGSQNTFMGYHAGTKVTEGSSNTFVGYKSGKSIITGSGNVFLGNNAGSSELGSNLLYIDNSLTNSPLIWGDFANNIARINGRLEVVSTGESVFIGLNAGSNDDGSFNRNTFIGYQSGLQNTTGAENTFNGRHSGRENTTGSQNTFVGHQAGDDVTEGSNNTFVGHKSGQNNNTGSGNVFLGNKAGESETGSNLLYIDNSATINPLIWGDFANNRLGINRKATTNTLEVGGDASKNSAGDWLANSDARLKKDIQPLNSEMVLEKLLSLQGVTYQWDDDKTGTERPEGLQYGFTAQNIQGVFPTLVSEDAQGYLQTAYGTYDAMYIEAIRALVQRIEQLETTNRELKADNVELKTAAGQARTDLRTEFLGELADLRELVKGIPATNSSEPISTNK